MCQNKSGISGLILDTNLSLESYLYNETTKERT